MAVVHPMAKNLNGFSDDTHRIVALIDSYRDFPPAAPVDTFLLACSGFQYTGVGDCVVCTSCNAKVENWKPGDDADLSKFHKPNCPRRNTNNASGSPFAKQRGNCGTSAPSAGDLLMGGFGGAPAYVPPYESVQAAPTGDTEDVVPHSRPTYSQFSKYQFEEC